MHHFITNNFWPEIIDVLLKRCRFNTSFSFFYTDFFFFKQIYRNKLVELCILALRNVHCLILIIVGSIDITLITWYYLMHVCRAQIWLTIEYCKYLSASNFLLDFFSSCTVWLLNFCRSFCESKLIDQCLKLFFVFQVDIIGLLAVWALSAFQEHLSVSPTHKIRT